MNIDLKEIDKDTLKVGDVVGVAREVSYGWGSSFRHQLIIPAKITRITPKRTKFFTDKFGEHDKREVFYVCDVNAGSETYLAKSFKCLSDGIYELNEQFDMGIDVSRVRNCQGSYDETDAKFRTVKLDKVLEELRAGGFEEAAQFLEKKVA